MARYLRTVKQKEIKVLITFDHAQCNARHIKFMTAENVISKMQMVFIAVQQNTVSRSLADGRSRGFYCYQST